MHWYKKMFFVVVAFVSINTTMYSLMNIFMLLVISLALSLNMVTVDIYIGSMLEGYLSGYTAVILGALSLPLISKNVRLYGTKFLEKVTKNW